MEKEFKLIPVHFVKVNGVVVTIDVCMHLNIRDMIDTCRFVLEDNNPKYIECRFSAFGSIYRVENPKVCNVTE